MYVRQNTEKLYLVVFSSGVDNTIKDTCLEISKRYQVHFLEIGTDNNHVHFLVQSVPMYSPTKIITLIKSITAREVFRHHPEVKEQLWGGEFWSDGYFINTVSKFGDESTISKYVREQGLEKTYKVITQNKSTHPLLEGDRYPAACGGVVH